MAFEPCHTLGVWAKYLRAHGTNTQKNQKVKSVIFSCFDLLLQEKKIVPYQAFLCELTIPNSNNPRNMAEKFPNASGQILGQSW